MSGEAFYDLGIYGTKFDEAIQAMSEYQVSSELDGHPLSPEMNRRFEELKRQFCHFAGLLQAVNYLVSGDSGEDCFDDMVKEEEEYRLGNIMPMDKVREQVEAQRLADAEPKWQARWCQAQTDNVKH